MREGALKATAPRNRRELTLEEVYPTLEPQLIFRFNEPGPLTGEPLTVDALLLKKGPLYVVQRSAAELDLIKEIPQGDWEQLSEARHEDMREGRHLWMPSEAYKPMTELMRGPLRSVTWVEAP